MKSFAVRYTIFGVERSFAISLEEIPDDQDLSSWYKDLIMDDMMENVSPHPVDGNMRSFINWARVALTEQAVHQDAQDAYQDALLY